METKTARRLIRKAEDMLKAKVGAQYRLTPDAQDVKVVYNAIALLDVALQMLRRIDSTPHNSKGKQ